MSGSGLAASTKEHKNRSFRKLKFLSAIKRSMEVTRSKLNCISQLQGSWVIYSLCPFQPLHLFQGSRQEEWGLEREYYTSLPFNVISQNLMTWSPLASKKSGKWSFKEAAMCSTEKLGEGNYAHCEISSLLCMWFLSSFSCWFIFSAFL